MAVGIIEIEISIGIEEIWGLDKMGSRKRKGELDRMAAMLSRLGGRDYQVREDQAAYCVDFDPEERKSRQKDKLQR